MRTRRINTVLILKIIGNVPLSNNEKIEAGLLQTAEFYNVSVPFESMSQLYLLRNIKALRIYNAHVPIPNLSGFVELTELHLMYMDVGQLSDIPSTVQVLKLKAIRGLTYSPEKIAQLPALQVLAFKHMPDLEYIPIPDSTRNYTELRKLKMSGCKSFKEFCEHTYRLPKLEIMVIRGMKKQRTPILNLSNLRFPPTLKQLKMRYLDIPYSENDAQNCFPILLPMDTMKLLDISQCTINTIGSRFKMPQLTMLIVTHCNLNSFALDASFPSLKIMILSNNHLVQMPPLAQSLQVLNLAHNNIRNASPELFALPSIISLFMMHNRLQTLPVDYVTLSRLATKAQIYNFSGNPLLRSVEDVITMSNLYRNDPATLDKLYRSWNSALIDVNCGEFQGRPLITATNVGIANHLCRLTKENVTDFYSIFENEMIPSECILCSQPFTDRKPAFVCNIHVRDVRYQICERMNEPNLKQIMTTDVEYERISHFAHVMHEECARYALLNKFECPATHFLFYDIQDAIGTQEWVERHNISVEDMWKIVQDKPPIPVSIDQFMNAMQEKKWKDTDGNAISAMYVYKHWNDDDPKIAEHKTRVIKSSLDYPIIIDPSNFDVLDGLHRLVCALLAHSSTILTKSLTPQMIEQFVLSPEFQQRNITPPPSLNIDSSNINERSRRQVKRDTMDVDEFNINVQSRRQIKRNAMDIDDIYSESMSFSGNLETQKERVEIYNYTNDKDRAEIIALDTAIFKYNPVGESLFETNGYFIRDIPSKCIASYLLYTFQTANSIYVDALGTRPEFRGRGLASKLLNELIKNHSSMKITLKVDVTNGENPKMIVEFYERFGFKVVYETKTMQRN